MSEATLLNQQVPDFDILATSNITGKLSNYAGKNIVLFFYPKDNTPVCTSEAKAFRDNIEGFKQAETIILGVSRDSLASHEKFKSRLELPFDLIADTKEELCDYFDVIKMKNFFGKQVSGIVRSTFIIDKQRILRYAWRKIKLTGHIEEVMTAVKLMQ